MKNKMHTLDGTSALGVWDRDNVVFPVAALLAAFAIGGDAYAGEADAEKLQEVEVKGRGGAKTQLQPVSGYNAKRSNTATKTDSELVNVPQAISVVTEDIIKDQSVQSIADAVRYVPGVTAIQGEGNRDAIVLRGNASTGDFYQDGVRDDIQTYRDLYNTERVEVLKGPNGMIFGRGASGGAINRVSKEAGWDPIRQVTASYGAYNQKRISADIGNAINDVAAFRINTVYENSDSYRNGYNLERYGITPTFTLLPSDRTKIVVSAEYFKDERTVDRGVPSVNGANNSQLNNRPFNIGNYSQFFGSAALSPTATETKAFNATVEHAFDNGITLRNRTRYADYDKYYQNVFADGPVRNNGMFAVGNYVDNTDRKNFFNQTDLMYSAKTGIVEHKLLVGMEFGKQKTNNTRFDNASLGSILATTGETTANVLFTRPQRDQHSNVDVAAFYAQDQIILSSQWQAIVGVRYDRFDTKFNSFNFNSQLNDQQRFAADTKDDFLSPRAGLIYKPMQNVSLYANYSMSYVPRAGDQLIGLTSALASFAPEKFINKELGAKWDINSSFALTAAIYQLDREKVAVADPSNTQNTILVDGQQTKGVELGASGNITSQYSIFGGYAYQDGEITKQQGAGNSAILPGAALAQTPKHAFSLWNRYDFNSVWGAAIGIISRTDMYALTPTVTQSTILPGYTRLDAALFAKLNKNVRLQVNLENITNKEYALYAHNNNNITPGSPLAGRATLIYDF